MKIVFFTSGLSGGGAERVCCNLANFLCQREHDIEFITISDDEATYPLSTKISRQALLHQQERSNFLHDNLLRFYRVCKLIRKTRCDCYIVMLPIPTILLLSLRFLTKAKIIASERVDPSTYPPSKQKRLKKVAHKADGWARCAGIPSGQPGPVGRWTPAPPPGDRPALPRRSPWRRPAAASAPEGCPGSAGFHVSSRDPSSPLAGSGGKLYVYGHITKIF